MPEMPTRAPGWAEMELIVTRADGTVEPPVLVEAALTAELAAAHHPSRLQRIRWGLVAAWERFVRDVAIGDDTRNTKA